MISKLRVMRTFYRKTRTRKNQKI